MEITISRIASDKRLYSIQSDSSTRYGVPLFEIKEQLLDFGIGYSTIIAVSDLEPDESVTVRIAEKAA
jgi:hypothetical protein